MSLRFENARRTFLLAAHPDDESIGAGSILSSLPALTIIVATDGAPLDMEDARRCGFTAKQDYADTRKRELRRALEIAGAGHAGIVEWNVPDKQAAGELVRLTKLLTPLLRDGDLLMTHPYEGGHPDHDSCAFLAHAAARLCGQALTLIEFTSYHRGDAGLIAGEFLGESQDVHTIELTEEQKERKRRMLSCFTTQSQTLSQFPIERERFRLAPAYDFAKPPHAGQLLYEQFGWRMDGAMFCGSAARAMKELGIEGTL